MRAWQVIPPAPAITLEEAKDQLRVTHGEDDAAILDAVKEASAKVEMECSKAFGPQTWEAQLDTFPRWIDLNPGPLVSIASLTYLDADAVEQTVAPADYLTGYANSGGAYLYAKSAWPTTTGGIVVRYVVGRGWPLDVKRAVKLLVSHWYDNRGILHDPRAGATEMPFAVTSLLQLHRAMVL